MKTVDPSAVVDAAVDPTADPATELAESNRLTAIRVYHEITNQRRLELIEEVYGDDMIDHAALPGTKGGIEGIRSSMRDFMVGVPDLHNEVCASSAHGDFVAIHLRVTGTHTGVLAGMPASGRRIDASGVIVLRLRDGLIRERWSIGIQEQMLEQLGVNPLIAKGLARRRRTRPE